MLTHRNVINVTTTKNIFFSIQRKNKFQNYNEIFLSEILGTKEERHKLDVEKMKYLWNLCRLSLCIEEGITEAHN